MRYPAAETAEKHARILESAIRLFRDRGFGGVSLAEIMQATGLTHGPFYNHFDSKEDLIAECIAADKPAVGMYTDFPPTADGRADYLKQYLSPAHRDSPSAGCSISALSSEIRHIPRARSTFTARIRGLVDSIGAYFPWTKKKTSRAEAIQTLSAMVGAMVLARAVDDEALSDEILRETLRGLIKSKDCELSQPPLPTSPTPSEP